MFAAREGLSSNSPPDESPKVDLRDHDHNWLLRMNVLNHTPEHGYSTDADDVGNLKRVGEIAVNQSRFLAHALRSHNADAQNKPMIVQGVLEDIMSQLHDLPMLRCAAVTHLETLLGACKVLHSWWRKLDTRVNNHGYVRLLPDDRIAYTVTRDALNRILMHWDLSEDIIYRGGFNVYGAENGNLEHLKKRAASFSSFREYITTQAATQAGTEDVPLRFGDGRKPHELRPAEVPTWARVTKSKSSTRSATEIKNNTV